MRNQPSHVLKVQAAKSPQYPLALHSPRWPLQNPVWRKTGGRKTEDKWGQPAFQITQSFSRGTKGRGDIPLWHVLFGPQVKYNIRFVGHKRLLRDIHKHIYHKHEHEQLWFPPASLTAPLTVNITFVDMFLTRSSTGPCGRWLRPMWWSTVRIPDCGYKELLSLCTAIQWLDTAE